RHAGEGLRVADRHTVFDGRVRHRHGVAVGRVDDERLVVVNRVAVEQPLSGPGAHVDAQYPGRVWLVRQHGVRLTLLGVETAGNRGDWDGVGDVGHERQTGVDLQLAGDFAADVDQPVQGGQERVRAVLGIEGGDDLLEVHAAVLVGIVEVEVDLNV